MLTPFTRCQELSLAMRSEIYNAEELIASCDTPCDKLCMIWNGQVRSQCLTARVVCNTWL